MQQFFFEFVTESEPVDADLDDRYKYSFYKGDYNMIRRCLRDINWEERFEGKTLEEKYEILVDIIINLIELYVPKTKCIPVKPKPKWMTKEVMKQISVKEKAWKRLKARKTNLRAIKYRQVRNLVTSMVKAAKKAFEKQLCKDIKANPKHFWSFIRSKSKIKENVTKVRKPNGELTKNDQETANVLNRAFQSVFVREDTLNLPEFRIEREVPLIEEIEITVNMVDTLLKNINPDKAVGPDGVHPKILKECHSELAKPITVIIKESVSTGMVPTLWKMAKVCPVYKKGDKVDPLNYRPVSLTCIICKICEILIRNVLVAHLEGNNLLSDSQHGFRQKRSTLTNLLVYMEALTKAIDQHIPVDVNYLDCRKAFDTVPHKRLLVKLHAYGIRGSLLRWIEDFLSSREQVVEIRGKKSESLAVTSGVPQGSVLGPVLFLIYINDLIDDLECPTLLFADDAKVYKEIRNDEDVQDMKRDMLRLQEWSNKWLLEFNVEKCATLHVGYRNPEVEYQLNGKPIKSSEVEKDLGVYVSNDLKPSYHVGTVVKKANRMVGLIKRNFECLDKEMCRVLYCSLVRPHLEYAMHSWCPYYRKDIDEIEKVQRRVTKLVPELGNLEYEERCRQLGITPLEKRRQRGDLIETYKILSGMENIDHTVFFELHESSTRSNTRKLRKRGHWNTLVRANTYSVRVVNNWNSLPTEVVSAPSISTFKTRLDQSEWANAW